jgi:hypothetical protein
VAGLDDLGEVLYNLVNATGLCYGVVFAMILTPRIRFPDR